MISCENNVFVDNTRTDVNHYTIHRYVLHERDVFIEVVIDSARIYSQSNEINKKSLKQNLFKYEGYT